MGSCRMSIVIHTRRAGLEQGRAVWPEELALSWRMAVSGKVGEVVSRRPKTRNDGGISGTTSYGLLRLGFIWVWWAFVVQASIFGEL